MLYQVATGLLSSDEVAAPLRSILRRQKNVTVLMAEVVDVDPHNRIVLSREGRAAYDYLILATGIDYNYFGHEERKAHESCWPFPLEFSLLLVSGSHAAKRVTQQSQTNMKTKNQNELAPREPIQRSSAVENRSNGSFPGPSKSSSSWQKGKE